MSADRQSGLTVHGRYRLERKLGAGAFGEVWLAEDTTLARRVALKFTATEKLAQLRQEAAALAQMRHEHVVLVYDVVPDTDTPVLVMEYVEGESLRQRMERASPVPVAEAVSIAGAVLAALEHAHGKGILHRDVKPENVLLGVDGVVRLGDFGLGKLSQTEISMLTMRSGRVARSSEGSLVRSGAKSKSARGSVSIAGTLAYMAPEQKQGEDSARSDVYAVGVLLYEMLCGRRPEGRFREPRAQNPAVSELLNGAILTALEPEPDERHASARAMREALTGGAPAPAEPQHDAADSGAGSVPDPEEIAYLRRRLTLDGDDLEARRLLGLLQARCEPAEARQWLEECAAASPADEEVGEALVGLLEGLGEHAAAVEAARGLARASKSRASLALLERTLESGARAALARRSASQADPYVAELERLNVSSAESLRALVTELRERQAARSVAARRKRLLGQARAALAVEEVVKARQLCEELGALGPPSEEVEALRGEIDACRSALHARLAGEVRTATERGDFATAEDALNRWEGLGASKTDLDSLRRDLKSRRSERQSQLRMQVSEAVQKQDLAGAERALADLRKSGAPKSATDAAARDIQNAAIARRAHLEAGARAALRGGDYAAAEQALKDLRDAGAASSVVSALTREAQAARLAPIGADARASLRRGDSAAAEQALEDLRGAGAASSAVNALVREIQPARRAQLYDEVRAAVRRGDFAGADRAYAELNQSGAPDRPTDASARAIQEPALREFRAACDEALADGPLTDESKARLRQLTLKLGLTSDVAKAVWREAQAARARTASQVGARVAPATTPTDLPAAMPGVATRSVGGASTPAGSLIGAKDGSVLVPIPAGEATIGSPEGQGRSDERPQCRATLPAYYIGRDPVTNAQYQRFLEATRHRPPAPCKGPQPVWTRHRLDQAFADHPVVGVTWEDASAYCVWAGLRLPTEREWERAARSATGRTYPWGDEWDASRCCSNRSERGRERTAAVGNHAAGASPYGVQDMAGNVGEWCADWYDPAVYSRYATGDLRSPASGKARVVRGGSWHGDSVACRCAARASERPGRASDQIGFRVARDFGP